jgi:hypothetical protein
MKNLIKYAILLLIALFIISCGGDDDNPVNADVTVTTMSPSSGPVGTKVKITGTNFADTRQGNIVSFENNILVVADSIYPADEPTQIFVTVPNNAQSGPVYVDVNGNSNVYAGDFTVTTGNTSFDFPNEVGEYTINHKYQLDTFDLRTNDPPVIDSTAITGTKDLLGETAFIHSVWIKDNNAWEKDDDELYFYTENSALYSYSNYLNRIVEIGGFGDFLPFDIEDQWLRIADRSANEWEVYSRTFTDFEVEVLGSTAIINGVLKVDGTNLGTESLTIDNENLQTYKFENRYSFDGTIEYGGEVNEAFVARDIISWYADGIGQVKLFAGKFEIDIPLIQRVVPGFEVETVKHDE